MPDLYLVAHKARGDVAFDIAHEVTPKVWISTTFGWRLYPFWSERLNDVLSHNPTWNKYSEPPTEVIAIGLRADCIGIHTVPDMFDNRHPEPLPKADLEELF